MATAASEPGKAEPNDAPGDAPPARLAEALDITPYAKGVAGEAWALITRLFFLEGKPRFPAIAAELDLSPPQALALRLLDRPRPMGELAQAMHCDRSNITGIVDRLEENGLARRVGAERDRRVKLIEATEEGRRVREELTQRLAEAPEAIAGLPERDARTLRDILHKALEP